MNKAYLRHLNESEKFEITFQYVDPEARINRQFNLCRQVSETISSFTTRVATNMDKVIKKKNKNQTQPPIKVSVSVNGNQVKDDSISCKDIFVKNTDRIVLNVCNQQYDVIINSPWVSGLALPNSILANFPVYPVKFESQYTDRGASEFSWFKSKNKTDWTLIGDRFIYQPSNGDIDSFLKISCLPRNGDLEGPRVEAVSAVQVQAGPGFCPFETRHEFTKEKCKGESFRVVSYNILADLYCDSDFTREVLHPYCPAYALSFDYRKQLIIKELTGYNADLICLQEVDKKIYNYDLQPFFEQLGYNSDFCIKRGLVAEGLALFYNRARFKQLETFRLVLSDELNTNQLFSDIWERIAANKELSARILDRSTVLQANILESLDNNEVLIVANTHLYFHPDADHIRLLQGAVIIRYLEHLVDDFKNKVTDQDLRKYSTISAQVVPFPSSEELSQHTALPSIVFPSDHIALISDLKWT
ncbi:2',5'-phosphodiesterase 12 [Asbolus verrucosus]|uniref:2',5'-phosphodiesterase 12 n=1 Tax=Asbolus verrucosus TaxID=1661398 RepID=A0A482VTH5_ASBVE|nr:2',5'-phosphodiesterase 12 [Asbolus verrucosus]